MVINKLKIQSFKSFTKEQVLDFNTIDTGVTFVTGVNNVEPELGANGVGKSALFNALCFAFFGKTAENLKAGDIANWSKGEKCVVIVEFEQRKVLYTLTRKWNPNSLELKAEHPEGFYTEKVVTQEDVEKVIGMNFESFLYSVFISQFGQKFIDFTPSEKMEVFSEIMDDVLKKWDGYGEKAKKLRDEKEKLTAESEKDIANLEGQIKSINVESLKIMSTNWEKEKEQYIERGSKKLNNIDITPYEESISDCEKEIKQAMGGTEELEGICRHIQTEYELLKFDFENTRDGRVKQETLLSMKEKNLADFQDMSVESVCSKCGQELTKEYTRKEIKELKKIVSLMATDYKEICEKEKELKEKVNNVYHEIEKNSNKLLYKHDDIKEWSNAITLYKSKIEATTKEIETTKKSIEEMKNQINPYASLYEENKDKLNILKRQLLYKKEGLQNTVKDFEIYKYWIKGFKDIKLLLTEDALKEFEIEINNNLTKLGLSTDWSSKLGINSENKSGTTKKGFSILIISPLNDSPVPFECYSGGEGQRVRLAVTMGLVDFIKNRRGVRSNILILDEPTQFLSEGGIEDLIDFLREKAKEDDLKIFLIDHRNLNTYGQFSNILTVIKDLNGSRIE